MHNIHNYDNNQLSSNRLMFNYYVCKRKSLDTFNQISVWLSFQLSIIFFIGIPVALTLWSIKKEIKLLKNFYRYIGKYRFYFYKHFIINR